MGTNDIRLAEQQKDYKRESLLRDEQIQLKRQIMSQTQAKLDFLHKSKQHLRLSYGVSPQGPGQRDVTQPHRGYAGPTRFNPNFMNRGPDTRRVYAPNGQTK